MSLAGAGAFQFWLGQHQFGEGIRDDVDESLLVLTEVSIVVLICMSINVFGCGMYFLF